MNAATIEVTMSPDVIAAIAQAKDGAYAERNQLVAFLSHVYPSYLTEATDASDGWQYVIVIDLHWNEPTVFGDARNAFGPCYARKTAQASWHVPDTELGMFRHLEVRPNAWDGHTTEEKYARLATAGRHFVQTFKEQTK